MPLPFTSITEINTQARRLRYVSALVGVLNNDSLTFTGLRKRLERWANLHQIQFDTYASRTGRVNTAPSAAEGYLALSTSFGLVTKVTTLYRLTRKGRIVRILLDSDDKEQKDTFGLMLSEKVLYFLLVLQHDADFFLTIFAQVSNGKVPLRLLQKNFQSALLGRVQAKIEAGDQEGGREHEQIKVALQQRYGEIDRQWKKPLSYAEKIVPPRLHWLFDCGMLNSDCFEDHRYGLNVRGQRVWNALPRETAGLVEVTPKWLEENFFTEVAIHLLDKPARPINHPDEARETILEVLDDAFRLMRSPSAPKASLPDLSLLVCLQLLAFHNVAVNVSQLNLWLSKGQSHSGFDYQAMLFARANEQYIIRRRNSSSLLQKV